MSIVVHVCISSVQSLSCVRLFATPLIAARQASLSITNSRSSLRLISIKSVIPSSHLILGRPLLLLPPIPPSIRVFSNESTLRMRWPKYWSFSFSAIPSKEHPGFSHSIVFLYFFALIAEEGFLIFPCYSLKLCVQWVYLPFCPLLFTSLLFTDIYKASSDSHFAFLHFFSMGMILLPVSCTMAPTSIHSSSDTLSIRSSPLNLFLTSTV